MVRQHCHYHHHPPRYFRPPAAPAERAAPAGPLTAATTSTTKRCLTRKSAARTKSDLTHACLLMFRHWARPGESPTAVAPELKPLRLITGGIIAAGAGGLCCGGLSTSLRVFHLPPLRVLSPASSGRHQKADHKEGDQRATGVHTLQSRRSGVLRAPGRDTREQQQQQEEPQGKTWGACGIAADSRLESCLFP